MAQSENKLFQTNKNRGLFIKQHEIAKMIKLNEDVPRCTVGDTVKIKKFNCNGIIRYIGDTHFQNEHGTA